jgi:hypothetical protein
MINAKFRAWLQCEKSKIVPKTHQDCPTKDWIDVKIKYELLFYLYPKSTRN